jgi:uncharacterized 2Fe-2S/4Fe-4S cluster protein (DUF4445 family)
VSDGLRVELFPLGVSFEVSRGAALANVLAEHGIEFPCGGAEMCGGCRVRVLEGVAAPTEQDARVFTRDELLSGWRLGCQLRAETALKLYIDQWAVPILADDAPLSGSARSGLGIAVDLGTTTIAAQLLDLSTGNVLAVKTMLNPQATYGADIMTRVSFTMTSSDLTPLIRQAIGQLIRELAANRQSDVVEVVLVGNVVMHHLFSSLDVEPLSHVPFASPNLGEQSFTPEELNWNLPSSCRIRFLRCIGGFVGSDILAGIGAVNLASGNSLRALIDLGTNGEIAIGNCKRILCASTAAGPAFEAASIRMGMRASTGAINRVSLRNGILECAVIGDVPARGICGSGVVDAVAAGLQGGAILPSGRLASGARELPLAAPVTLSQADIHELQLAKGAIAAGLRILLSHWGAGLDDLEAVYLSGAFGNYVRAESAVRIGLLEVPPERILAAGNTALRGAKMLLLAGLDTSTEIEHVSLALDPGFQDTFVDCLTFPQGETLPVRQYGNDSQRV